MKNTISFSIALFATAIVLSTASPAPITPFCANATEKALCNKMVNGATTVANALTNGLKFSMQKVKVGKPIIDSISSKLPENKESINIICQDTYKGMIEAIQKAMKNVNGRNLDIESVVSSITEIYDCQDRVRRSNVMIPEMDKFSDDLKKVADTLLEVSRYNVTPFCVNAFKMDLCKKMVNGSTTVVGAMTNGLKVSMQIVKGGKPVIDSISSRLPGDMSTSTKESIISTCQATYKGIIENIHEAMKNVNNQDFDIESAVDNIEINNCQLPIRKSSVRIIPELDEFSDELSWVANTLFTILRFKQTPKHL